MKKPSKGFKDVVDIVIKLGGLIIQFITMFKK